MIQIFNTHLKTNTTTSIALTKLTGIGKRIAFQVCDQLGISANMRLNSLSSFQLNKLSQLIYQNYLIGAEYRSRVKRNKNRLCSISTYRGFRHLEGLPCRGQRTHGTARTSRKHKALK